MMAGQFTLLIILAILTLLAFLAVGIAVGANVKLVQQDRIRRAQQTEILRVRTKAAQARYELDIQAYAARNALLDLMRRGAL